MIQVSINNEFLDLRSNTSVSFELNSPLNLDGDADAIQGEFGFSLSLPRTARNKAILHHIDSFGNRKDKRTFQDGKLYVDNELIFTGVIEVNNINDDIIAKFYGGIGALKQLKETYLTDLDIAYSITQADITANNHNDYCFFLAACEDTIVNVNHDGVFDFSHPVIPFFRLLPILHKVLGDIGYTVKSNYLKDQELQELVLLNNKPIFEDNGTFDFNINEHLPKITTADFIKKIVKWFNLSIYVNPFRKEIHISKFDTIQTQLDWSDKVMPTKPHEFVELPTIFKFENYQAASFQLGTHYVRRHQFSKYYSIESTNLYKIATNEPQRIKLAEGNEYTMPVNLPELVDIYRDKTTGQIGISEYFGDADPKRGGYLDYTTGQIVATNFIRFIAPRIDEKLIEQGNNKKVEKCWVCFNRGEQNATPGDGVYFMGTTLNVDGNNLTIANLTVHVADWSKWYAKIDGQRLVTVRAKLKLTDIISFDFRNKVVFLADESDNLIPFLVKQIKVSINKKGIQPATVKLVSLK